jgi:hypothetical protein
MRCKNPCVFLRRCALGWYVRLVTQIPFQLKDRLHYNTPYRGCWQAHSQPGLPRGGCGQPGDNPPSCPQILQIARRSTSLTAHPTRLVAHRQWFHQDPLGKLSTVIFTPVDRRTSTVSYAQTAEVARGPRTSVRQERLARCENHRTLPQELSTLMIIVCSLADRGEMCPPSPDTGRSSCLDGQSRFPFHTTRQRTACAHDRLAALETSGVVRR